MAAPAAAPARPQPVLQPVPDVQDPVPAPAATDDRSAAATLEREPAPTPSTPAPATPAPATPAPADPLPAPEPAPEVDILALIPPELLQSSHPTVGEAEANPARLSDPTPPAPAPAPADYDLGAMLRAEFRQPPRARRRRSEAERAAQAQEVPLPASNAPGNPTIAAATQIAGFVGSCLVDGETGLMLASEGGGGQDLEAVAALYTEVVRAEHEVIERLGLDDRLEDMLVTTSSRYHVLRPLEAAPGVFLYLALDRQAANLGMARRQLGQIEGTLTV